VRLAMIHLEIRRIHPYERTLTSWQRPLVGVVCGVIADGRS
jgi:hypothetical protein